MLPRVLRLLMNGIGGAWNKACGQMARPVIVLWPWIDSVGANVLLLGRGHWWLVSGFSSECGSRSTARNISKKAANTGLLRAKATCACCHGKFTPHATTDDSSVEPRSPHPALAPLTLALAEEDLGGGDRSIPRRGPASFTGFRPCAGAKQ